MKRNKHVLKAKVVAVLAGLAVASACSGGSDDSVDAAGVTTIRLAAATASTTGWGAYVANEKGFFAKNDLKVTEAFVGSVQNAAQQVIGGSYDIGIVNLDATIQAIEGGAPLVAIGSPMIKSPFRLMVDSKVTGAKDFDGATVSMASSKDPDLYIFKQWLRENGVDDTKVKFVFSGTSTARYAALASGQAKGSLLIAPFDVQAQEAGYKSLLNFADIHAGSNYGFLAFVVRKDWLAKHEPQARSFLKAFAEGNDWLQDPANQTEATAILAKDVKIKAPTAAAVYDYYMNTLKPFPANAELPVEYVQGAMDLISKTEGPDLKGETPDKYMKSGLTPQ